MKTIFRLGILPALLLGGLLLVDQLRAAPTTPASLNWAEPLAITAVANTPYGATRPVIAAAPDGQKLVLAFNRQMSPALDNNDPWFARSTNRGQTWQIGAIHTSDANSLQLDIALDADAQAHAAWREGNGVAYAAESDWPDNRRLILNSPSGAPGANNPALATSAPARIDIVWSSGDNSSPNIYHAVSDDNGRGWIIADDPIADTPASSLFPDIAADASGTLHLVWEEHDGPVQAGLPPAGNIYYAQLSGGNWSTPLLISTLSGANDARRPAITVGRNGVHVSYTERFEVSSGGFSDVQQWVHHLRCAADCTTAAAWQPSPNPVSGDTLRSNLTEPYDVVSTVAVRSGCAHVYFHGIQPDFTTPNEAIFGTGSCTGWADSPRQQLTLPDEQSLFPSMAVIADWSIWLAYQSGTDLSQIYVTHTEPDVFMPLLMGGTRP